MSAVKNFSKHGYISPPTPLESEEDIEEGDWSDCALAIDMQAVAEKLGLITPTSPPPNVKLLLLRPVPTVTDAALKVAEQMGAGNSLPRVAEITACIFPGSEMTIDATEDPEIADLTSIIVKVAATGAVAELVAKNTEWHRQLLEIESDHTNLFCLALDIQ